MSAFKRNLLLSELGQHSQKESWNLPALLNLETAITIGNTEGRCPRRWLGGVSEWSHLSAQQRGLEL